VIYLGADFDNPADKFVADNQWADMPTGRVRLGQRGEVGAVQIFGHVGAADGPAQHFKDNFTRSRLARFRHGLDADVSITVIDGGFHQATLS
jgi:hypothetical protein